MSIIKWVEVILALAKINLAIFSFLSQSKNQVAA